MSDVCEPHLLVNATNNFSGLGSGNATVPLCHKFLRYFEDLVATQNIAGNKRMGCVCTRQIHNLGVFLMLKLIANRYMSREHSVRRQNHTLAVTIKRSYANSHVMALGRLFLLKRGLS